MIFPVVRRVKWQKMAQNEKKFCLFHSVSQELYFILLWFLVHLCKMIFSFFEILIFLVFRGRKVKGQKMTHNYQFQSVTLYISRTVDHIMNIIGTLV